jgi:hypothetical protein
MVQIMIHSKFHLATRERNIVVVVVTHLQLVWWPSTRNFPEDSMTNLTALHEFSKFQRKPLTFTALGIRKGKEAK